MKTEGEDVPERYRLLQQASGVRVTVCENRFEILVEPGSDAREQHLMGMVRDWVRDRRQKAQLRKPGDLPD